jgi:hypothetical protein
MRSEINVLVRWSNEAKDAEAMFWISGNILTQSLRPQSFGNCIPNISVLT